VALVEIRLVAEAERRAFRTRFGERAGAFALMIAWSRSPVARSGCGSAAIFASTALSLPTLAARRPGRASAFSSYARCLIAIRSLSVNPLDFFAVAGVLLAPPVGA
jgi:hypothetical protein